jgi:two-component system, NarL family, response regulator NreC
LVKHSSQTVRRLNLALAAGGVISNQSVVRVLVVDDFDEWRSVIKAKLEGTPNWRVIGEASNGSQAVIRAKELLPDLILLDISMPEMDGIAAAQQIAQIVPGAKILFLSQTLDPSVARAALQVGGHGYVIKSHAAGDLFPAMEAVMLGKRFVSPRLKGIVLADDAGSKSEI